MNTSEQEVLPSLLAYGTASVRPRKRVIVSSGEPLAHIKERQAQAYRWRLGTGVLLSVGLHLALFVNYGAKPVVARARPAPAPIVVEVAVEAPEPPEVLEDVVDDSLRPQPLDLAVPTLADSPRIALSTDFLTTVAPPPIDTQQLRGDTLRIPSSDLRGSAMSPNRVFNLAELDHQPELLKSVRPLYPVELQGSNISGIVVVHFVVNSRGAVRNAELVSAPHPALGAAVLRAIEKWSFKAGMKAGRAVSTDMELPVRFNVE